MNADGMRMNEQSGLLAAVAIHGFADRLRVVS